MMITVEEARRIIRDTVTPLPAGCLELSRLQGRVLAGDVAAPFAMPRFTNAAMDGFALRRDDVATASADAPARLQVITEVAAGAVPQETVMPGTCAPIMTGAPLPEGADTVIPFEQTSGFNTRQVDIYSVPKKGANIRYAGEEVKEGSRLLSAGTVLAPGRSPCLRPLVLPERWSAVCPPLRW